MFYQREHAETDGDHMTKIPGNRTRQGSVGAGLVGGAVAAAMVGVAGAPTAHADDLSADIAFLDAAASDVNEVFSLTGQTPLDADIFSQIETIQTPLLSSDNSLLSGLGDSLFDIPDQQLAQSADTVLSAAQTYTADPSAANGLAELSAGLQFDGTLLGDVLPATVVGKIVDDFAGLSTAAPGAATDIAASAATASNLDDPAVFYYSADPTNVFSPVYTISPTGAEDVISTDGSGDIVGTQEFTVSYVGIPLDTFNGGVEYSPVSSPLDPFGSPYVEDISTLGSPGSLLPDNTGFLVEEFGGGYGYLTDVANITGTSPTVGDFILTPFGPDNITSLVNEFLNFAGSATDTTSAVDPSSFLDLLSSIGL